MYVKLFSSIYQGTLRGNSHGLLVFTNLLAHADKEGFVDIHPRAISEEVGLTVDAVRTALLMLEATDPESRTADLDGRRIVRLDEHRAWGWQIVNYVKYREIKNADDRRQQNREAQARFRQKHKQSSAPVSTNNHLSAASAHAEEDAEVHTEERKTGRTRAKRATPPEVAKPDDVTDQVWADWCALRLAKKTTVSETALTKARKEAAKAQISLDAFLSVWCLRGSQGLEASWLTKDERSTGETTYQRNRREFMTEHFPAIAAKPPGHQQNAVEFFETEALNVAPRRLG